jgi:hypothetical protein
VDYTTSRFNRGSNTCTDPDHQDAIPVPLYELVYHDAVVTASSPNNLRAFLHGNAPQLGYGRTVTVDWSTNTVEIQPGSLPQMNADKNLRFFADWA